MIGRLLRIRSGGTPGHPTQLRRGATATFARRFARLVGLLLVVSVATFLMTSLVPGDPAVRVLGPDASPDQYAAVRAKLGLDEPILTRLGEWLGNAVTGDLGTSLLPPARDVRELVISRLPVTLEVTVLAMAIALLIAIPVGVLSAYREAGWADRVSSGAAFSVISVPHFLGALLLVYLLVFYADRTRSVVQFGLACLVAGALIGAVAARVVASRRVLGVSARACLVVASVAVVLLALAHWSWPSFPRQGFVRLTSEDGVMASIRSAFLPALTLGLTEGAVLSRVLRSDMIATLNEDFILSARAKGVSTARLLIGHALRPSSFSMLTVAGVSLGRLIGGTFIVEAIFGIPGMGTMVVDAIVVKDFPIVQGGVLVIAASYIVINYVVDVLYVMLDPRLRRG